MTRAVKPLDDQAFDTLFREARTYKSWSDKPVSEVQIKQLYDLTKWGPTSANCCPARFIFIQTPEAKERLKPYLDAGNVDKTMTAPVTVLIANDLEFYEQMGRLMPHNPKGREMFAGKPSVGENAMRNGTLQGAYMILAARAMGLNCGPMSGFNKEGVKTEFFADKNWEANFLCNIGYGTEEGLFPRAPRLDFDVACEIL